MSDSGGRLSAVLAQLKVIAKCKRGDKLSTKGAIFSIDPDVPYQGMLRLLRGESRERMVHRIDEAIREAIHQVPINISAIVENRDLRNVALIQSTQRIIAGLRESQQGLVNLIATYEDDARTVAQLTVCIDTIADFLQRTSNVPPAHSTSDDGGSDEDDDI